MLLRLKDRLIKAVMAHPALNLILISLITVFFVLCALRLQFDTSLSAFVIRNDPDLKYYNEVKDIFDTDETVVISFAARDLFSKEDLSLIERMSDNISNLQHVRNVRSLTKANLITATPDIFEVKALIEEMPKTEAESNRIKKDATTNYIYIKDIASLDGRFGSLLVDIENSPGKQYTKEVVGNIKEMLKVESKSLIDSGLARIRCRMSEHNSTKILNMIENIKKYARNNINPNLTVRVTSYPVIYSNMVDSLARGQLRCLIIVLISLLLVTSIYFRSLKIGLLALIPNIIPISVTFGVMGHLGITLNIATAMTSGIAIGLAMDDTTHFFTYFKQRYSKNPDYIKDTKSCIMRLGEPMMYSSYLMIAGYLVLVLSQFRLTVFFGLLCALTIMVALICDLFITPWILMVFHPAFTRRDK